MREGVFIAGNLDTFSNPNFANKCACDLLTRLALFDLDLLLLPVFIGEIEHALQRGFKLAALENVICHLTHDQIVKLLGTDVQA